MCPGRRARERLGNVNPSERNRPCSPPTSLPLSPPARTSPHPAASYRARGGRPLDLRAAGRLHHRLQLGVGHRRARGAPLPPAHRPGAPAVRALARRPGAAAPRRVVRPSSVLGRRSAPPRLRGHRRRHRCAASGGGAPALVGLVVVTGALLWLALPVRPRLRLPVQVDPLLAPLALVAAAVRTPYVLDQIALQNAAPASTPRTRTTSTWRGWSASLVVLAILGAVVPAVRRLGAGRRRGAGVDRCDGRCCSTATGRARALCWCSACR